MEMCFHYSRKRVLVSQSRCSNSQPIVWLPQDFLCLVKPSFSQHFLQPCVYKTVLWLCYVRSSGQHLHNELNFLFTSHSLPSIRDRTWNGCNTCKCIPGLMIVMIVLAAACSLSSLLLYFFFLQRPSQPCLKPVSG